MRMDLYALATKRKKYMLRLSSGKSRGQNGRSLLVSVDMHNRMSITKKV